MKVKINALLGTAAMVLGAGAAPITAQALTINPIFATSYTGVNYGIGPIVSLTGDTEVDNMIDAATQQIAKQFGGTNITVNILYYGADDGTSGFLGASVSGQTVYTYGQYTSAQEADSAAHPGNTNLATAVANLGFGNGAGDPDNTYIAANTADARALGLTTGYSVPISGFCPCNATPQFDDTGDFLGTGGTVDGIVFLNLDQPLSYTRPIPTVAEGGVLYDARQTMEHETDEVLGIGGAGSTLNAAIEDPTWQQDFYGMPGDVSLIGPMDLYRYSAPGVPSWEPNPYAEPEFAYFSIDGGNTLIDTFNQEYMAYGDAADWGIDFAQTCPGGYGYGGSGSVQDAFSCNNEVHDVSLQSPEGKALEAIGYDPLPEPVTLSLFGAGLAGAAAIRRRKNFRKVA